MKKVLGGNGKKWMWSVLPWDLKIDCTSRMEWNELVFLHPGANSGKLKVTSFIFEWAWPFI